MQRKFRNFVYQYDFCWHWICAYTLLYYSQAKLFFSQAKRSHSLTKYSSTMLDDKYFMGIALKEAKLAFADNEVPVGAVIVSRNMVIARAHNMVEHLHDVTAHAEMQAITAASNYLGGKYLNDCTLYVTVEPCPMCAGAIGWAQVGRVVYGAEDPKRGYTHFAPNVLHPKATVTAGVRAEECAAIMSDFFRKKR